MYKAKILAIVFLVLGMHITHAAEFCQSKNIRTLFLTLQDYEDSILRIKNSDLMLTNKKRTQMLDSIQAIQALQSDKSKTVQQIKAELIQKEKANLDQALTSVEDVFKELDKAIANDTQNENFENRIADKIKAGTAEITKPAQDVGLNNSLETIFNKTAKLMASTEYFDTVLALVKKAKEQIGKKCLGPGFNFTSVLPDGKAYVFSDCLTELVNDKETDTWGGPIHAGSCRQVITCFTEEKPKEKKEQKAFKGFGYDWILDCKLEQGKCPMAETCANRIEGGGTTQIKKFDGPAGSGVQ